MNPLQNKETGAASAGYKPAQPLNSYDILMPPQSNFSDVRNPMFPPPNPMYQQVPFMNYMNLWNTGNFYSNYFGLPLMNSKALFPQGDIKNSFPFTSFNQQTLRVNSQDKRDKGQPEVIDLESDEEKQKNGNSIVPSKMGNNNSILKEIQIIELDDNSQNQPEFQKLPKTTPLGREVVRKFELRQCKAILDRLDTFLKSPKYNKSEITEKLNQIKLQNQKYRKQQKLLKINRLEKSSLKKREKEKVREDLKRAREERVKLKLKLKQQRAEKAEKIRIMKQANIMRRVEQPTMKQIERYNESHGEIRLGCEFQSYIPNIPTRTEQFNAWLLCKKKQILMREVGPLTY